ncbi:MAG: hypothetical protein M1825_001767 [Sarcosagium campestre]|nr:MAG: hypothetical protein M1825_001767 [Sarcosagium campestre]
MWFQCTSPSQTTHLEDHRTSQLVKFSAAHAARPMRWRSRHSAEVQSAEAIGSDDSSVASSGDRVMAEDAQPLDTQKYRIPGHVDASHKALPSLPHDRNMESRLDSALASPTSLPSATFSTLSESAAAGQNETDQALADFSERSHPVYGAYGLQRSKSIYSLSRASLASQIAQLKSLLPQTPSFQASITAIPNVVDAARSLTSAFEQIRRWIAQADNVIEGLRAEDEVEWAAAGGREAIDLVDGAIGGFESLMAGHVGAVEKMQGRDDIGSLPPAELRRMVVEMETSFSEWKNVKKSLQLVQNQTKRAMEWEELWNEVLGDVDKEINELNELLFALEERRNNTMTIEDDSEDAVVEDVGELSTINEESSSGNVTPQQNGFGPSMAYLINSTNRSPAAAKDQEDTTLLALFARLQPLQASLDFLPMRLQRFEAVSRDDFPSACEELEEKHASLSQQFKKLERDAETLRCELSEDRWVLVFRNANRQCLKLCASVQRSLGKVREAVEAGTNHCNPASMAKSIENFEARKQHYRPAIQRVLSMIDNGVKGRRTVNGEILRLQEEAHAKWQELQDSIAAVDGTLEELSSSRTQPLRDSISSSFSMDRSAAGSTVETPGSSPASSVVFVGPAKGKNPSTPATVKAPARRRDSSLSSLPRPSSAAARHASMPAGVPQSSRKSLAPRLSSTPVPPPRANQRLSSPSRLTKRPPATPTPSSTRASRPSLSTTEGRPRWNSGVNARDSVIGHNVRPASTATPSPRRRASPRSSRRSSLSLSQADSQLPSPSGTGSRPASMELARTRLPQPSPRGNSGGRPFSPSALSSSLAKLPMWVRRPSPARSASSAAANRSSLNPANTGSAEAVAGSGVVGSSRAGTTPGLKPKASASNLPERRRSGLMFSSTTNTSGNRTSSGVASSVNAVTSRPASAMARASTATGQRPAWR